MASVIDVTAVTTAEIARNSIILVNFLQTRTTATTLLTELSIAPETKTGQLTKTHCAIAMNRLRPQ
jgi:hypothetical protein